MINTQQATDVAPNTVLSKLHLNPYKKQRHLLIAALVLQTGLLTALTIQPAMTMVQGRTVTFKTSPVDTRDVFRGDFVTLSYSFSSAVPLMTESLPHDTPIYVLLKKDKKGEWSAAQASVTRPQVHPEEIVLKGKVDYAGAKTASVRYGIERVYVGEGSGRNVNSGSQLQVDVAVNDNGDVVVKELRSADRNLYKFRWL